MKACHHRIINFKTHSMALSLVEMQSLSRCSQAKKQKKDNESGRKSDSK